MNKTQTVQLNYLHMAPRKVRLITDTLKNLTVNEAEAQLLLRPHRAAQAILKLLHSAKANAKQNQKIDPQTMIISKITVNQGPMLKRFLPRAQGRATPIQKKMSHITLVLEESAAAAKPRFQIIPPKKEKKVKPAKSKIAKPKITEVKKEKPKEKVGFFRRLFRRKSV
jgi:large subunit ribosomal protein L22